MLMYYIVFPAEQRFVVFLHIQSIRSDGHSEYTNIFFSIKYKLIDSLKLFRTM